MVNRPEWSSVGMKERARAGQDARRPRSHTSISGFGGAQGRLKKPGQRLRRIGRMGRTERRWLDRWDDGTHSVQNARIRLCCARRDLRMSTRVVDKSEKDPRRSYKSEIRLDETNLHLSASEEIASAITIKVDLTSLTWRSFRAKWSQT